MFAGSGEHLAVAMRERKVIHYGRVTREQAGDVEVVRPDRKQLAVNGAHQNDAVGHQLYAGHGRIDVGRLHSYQQWTGGRRQSGVVQLATRAAGFLLYQLDDAVPGSHQHGAVRDQVQRRDAFTIQFHGSGGGGATFVLASRRVLGKAPDQCRCVGGSHHGRIGREVQFDFHHVTRAGAAVRVLVQPIDNGAQDLALDLGERTV